MAERTPGRGSNNTTSARRAGLGAGVVPLVRAASRRALATAAAVALLLHLPLLPTPLFSWLEAMFALRGELTDYDAGETIVPIDLDLLADDPSAVAAAPSATGAEATPGGEGAAAPATPPPTPPPPAASASAAPEAPDAGAPTPPRRRPPGDAGPDAAGDGGTGDDSDHPNLRTPLSVAGAPGKLASKDPNVQVLIAGDRLRSHELGEWFGRILTTIPQWQSFFQDTAVDPIRDIDHLLIAGPQLRDSSKVVAVMDYRAPEEAMRAAVDVVVRRSNGSWIEDAPVPAARATADRSERIFALVPDRRLLVVLPAEEEGQLSKLKSMKGFNKSSAAGIVISMLTPANAFRGVQALPKSIAWMRLTVTPTKDGGADLTLTAADESAEDALAHAQELMRTLNAIRTINLGITRIDVVDEVTFNTDGKVIWSKLHVTNRQLKLIMGFVEQALRDQAAARRK
ncbi:MULTISPECIES: hypothetical protein [Sorangium]|uniref:Uncharacterized protein n=1 Tax=Sorangium cellulosum TaxID=56 RepID=A0A4P2QQH9_SORCE|nr:MULTISPECIES: hypothetical protein [Sorangium]AUX32440.1 hypothetical protein SOCE836_045800 [Sorangium cellulosum]WCQ91813.1 hypothetical protein NQZ70_04539 [Sorangium sp. Soce836]